MSDENTNEIQSSVYVFAEESGRYTVGFCDLYPGSGPVITVRDYFVIRNPLHLNMQLVRDQQTGQISPNVSYLPVNLVGMVEVMYLREGAVVSCFEATGTLRDEYTKHWEFFTLASQHADSLVKPVKEISEEDIKAASAVAKMRVK